jgi:hypothetical protein
VPVSVFNASSELEDLQAYAHLDVERVLFSLPTLPENETLYHLQRIALILTHTRHACTSD